LRHGSESEEFVCAREDDGECEGWRAEANSARAHARGTASGLMQGLMVGRGYSTPRNVSDQCLI
jgi:hypothetical protein